MLALRNDFNAPPLPQHDKRPHAIHDAEWQAGVTYQNERYRILLNGEPLPLAFAASERKGWVLVYGEPERQKDGVQYIRKDALTVNPATGDNTVYRRLVGYVQIVKGDPLYREY